VVLVDLVLRCTSFTIHYTESGIAPLKWLSDPQQHVHHNWSLYFLHFSEIFSICLFVLTALSASAVLVGFKTKFFSVLTWVLVVSLHTKSPLILFGADSLLALLLFWSMWLPLQNHWSVDALKSKHQVTGVVQSWTSLALTLQVALVYWMCAITKGGAEWRVDHTAVERTLRIDYFSTEFGEYLLQFPLLLKVGTVVTLYLEEFAPFLLFLPFFRGNLKTLAVLSMVFFHLGMLGTTMHLGIFPFIGAVAWLPFLPTSFWDKITKPSEQTLPNKIQTPLTSSIICCCALMIVILWNVRQAFRHEDPWYFPKSLNWIGKTARLQQRWSLFAPRPNTIDGWLIAEATLRNGKQVDLITDGKTVNFTRPEEISSRFHSCRERTYLLHIFLIPNPAQIELFVESLKTQWTRNGGEEITDLTLYMMQEDNREPEKGIRRFQMWPYALAEASGNTFKEVPIGKDASN